MSIKSIRYTEEDVDKIIDEFFNGQTTISKKKFGEDLDNYRSNRGGRGGGRGGRGGRGGLDRSNPIREEMKQKFAELLESELNKINSDTVTKDQAKQALLSFSSQAKEQWHAQMDQLIQSSIQDELKKLKVNEVSSNQARDLLRNINNKMRPSHGGPPSMFDDRTKNEFLSEFKNKYGTKQVSADDVWELLQHFEKKQHEKMHSSDEHSEWEKEKEKKWEEIFNEQFKELAGDTNKKLNQEQLEQLAKKIKEKFRDRSECPQHPGKRFCQH